MNDCANVGEVCNEFTDTILEFDDSNQANLETEIA